MFDTMIESRHARSRRQLGLSGTCSLAAHVALVAAVLGGATRSVSPARAAPPIVVSWPERSDRGSTGAPSREAGAPRTPVIDVPFSVPLGVPPLDGLTLLDMTEWARDTGRAVSGAVPVADPGAPWSMGTIEEAPTLLAGPALEYPERLRRAGIAGRVVVEVVLDTLGRAESGSVAIVSSAHPGFGPAARDYMLRALFRPARVHGRPVRVLVRVPIDFRISAY